MKSKMASGSEIKLGFVKILFLIVIFVMIGIVVSAQMPPPQNDVSVEVTPVQQTGMPGEMLTYNVTLMNTGTVPDIIVVELITDIPAGWTVELKEAVIPRILPFQTPLLQSKESYPLTLDMHIPATATTGATVTITIHSYADNSKTDSAIISANISSLTPAPTPTPTAYHGDGGGVHPKVTPTMTQKATPTPIMTSTPEATPLLTPTTSTPIITPTLSPTPTPKPWWKIPGFEVIFAILGLLAVAYLLRRRKK